MLSLIVPVYRNETGIDALVAAVARLAANLGAPMECVFVVDASPDASHARLQAALKDAPFVSQLLLLSRNFGSFAAIRCGLTAARGEVFAVMAADLQEPPELVLAMHETLRTGQVDVVFGSRRQRADAWRHRTLATLFWASYRRLVVADVPPGGVDIFACNRTVRDSLLRLKEHNSSLVAQLFWLGYRRAFIPYDRQARQHGVSAWTFARKLRYLADSIFSFTDLPIRALLWGGASVAGLSGLVGSVVLVRRWLGYIGVDGYSALMLASIFFGALNLLATGLVGAYAWRTFENSKQRPLHLVRRHDTYGELAEGDEAAAALPPVHRRGRPRDN